MARINQQSAGRYDASQYPDSEAINICAYFLMLHA